MQQKTRTGPSSYYDMVQARSAVPNEPTIAMNPEATVPRSSGDAAQLWASNYDAYYEPGQPETAAVRRTDYEQAYGDISEYARARPYLMSASGLIGRQPNTAGATNVEGRWGAGFFGRQYSDASGVNVNTQSANWEAQSTRGYRADHVDFLRKPVRTHPDEYRFALTAEFVDTGMNDLHDTAAQPSQFVLGTFASAAPPGTYTPDPNSGALPKRHPYSGADAMATNATVGANPGYAPAHRKRLATKHNDNVSASAGDEQAVPMCVLF